MRTVVAQLSVPVSDQGEEQQQAVVDAISPYLSSLPERPLRRFGNVTEVTLLGGEVSGGRWSLLVLAEVDSAAPGLREELLELLPEGSEVPSVGTLGQIGVWPPPPDS